MKTPSEFVKAPWTIEQVDALNKFQRRGDAHEFTCGHEHGGDKTLFATSDGWRCPHCDYSQDWAHQMMFDANQLEKRVVLPCDVLLPPATIIRKGCDLGVLMSAFKNREGLAHSLNRFDDPIRVRPEDWVDH